MGTLRIDVLGAFFSIDAKEDDRYLDALLENYKAMISLVESNAGNGLTDPLQISIMAGIMLCDELYKEKQKSSRLAKQMPDSADLAKAEQLMLRIIGKIEKAFD
jgi:cell division protein ZapA (FtsZ GTPase activity inhibitor)